MRFAIYYSPSQMSLLHELGASWLGYNAFNGGQVPQPGDGLLSGKTEQPSHYGLHATLKAPFQLKPDRTFKDLQAGVANVAQKFSKVVIPKLVLSSDDGFLALVPEQQKDDVTALAKACVCDLDYLRRQPEESELKRRMSNDLTTRQVEYLAQWGYPYVLDQFRFHITLTRRLNGADMVAVTELAREHFAEILDQPLTISALTTFMEAGPGVKFRVADTFLLTGHILAAYA
jgi:hypothetical protein